MMLTIVTQTILIGLISEISATSFCDLCKCYESKSEFFETYVVDCNGEILTDKSLISTSHELQYLEWPITNNKSIIAKFNHLKLSVLPRYVYPIYLLMKVILSLEI